MNGTREKLIQTATELIWRNSYNAVSVDQICASAGVNKGSFYHYFPSKADLALVTMDSAMNALVEQYEDLFSSQRPPHERFTLMVEHIYQQQLERLETVGHVCGCPFATLGSELAPQDSDIETKIQNICARKKHYYVVALRDMIERDEIDGATDCEAKADEIFAFVVGILLMARIKNDLSFVKDRLENSLFDLIGYSSNN